MNVTCLDDVTDDELTKAPVTYLNGRDDNWDVVPLHTAYL